MRTEELTDYLQWLFGNNENEVYQPFPSHTTQITDRSYGVSESPFLDFSRLVNTPKMNQQVKISAPNWHAHLSGMKFERLAQFEMLQWT